MTKVLFVGLILTAGSLFGAVDPFLGVWTLNLAKSDFGGFAPPRSGKISFQITDTGVFTENVNVNARGEEKCASYTFNYDGKAYKTEEGSQWDGVIVNRVNSKTVEATYLLKGRIGGTARRVISPDCGSMRVITNILDPEGKVRFVVTLVYDRQ